MNESESLAESAEFDRKYNICSKIADQHNFVSVWSIYELIDSAESFQNVIHKDAVTIRYLSYGLPEVSVTVDGPVTMLDMWKAANTLILLSQDGHHVYVEGFHRNDDGSLQLSTGS
jgi:hypothetical protein